MVLYTTKNNIKSFKYCINLSLLIKIFIFNYFMCAVKDALFYRFGNIIIIQQLSLKKSKFRTYKYLMNTLRKIY